MDWGNNIYSHNEFKVVAKKKKFLWHPIMNTLKKNNLVPIIGKEYTVMRERLSDIFPRQTFYVLKEMPLLNENTSIEWSSKAFDIIEDTRSVKAIWYGTSINLGEELPERNSD